jgi:cardiolipin synthase
VIDNVVHIGSANFDVRSLFLNLEIMLRIEDQAFADHMRAYFEGEMADSHQIRPANHERAGWLTRLRWALAYYLMAVVDASVTRRLSFGVDR